MEYNIEPWGDYVDLLARSWDTKSLKHKIGNVSLGAISYIVWIERNKRIFFQEMKKTEAITRAIKNVIKEKAMKFTKVNMMRGDYFIKRNWRGHSLIVFSNICTL